jgi:hypothetical protein
MILLVEDEAITSLAHPFTFQLVFSAQATWQNLVASISSRDCFLFALWIAQLRPLVFAAGARGKVRDPRDSISPAPLFLDEPIHASVQFKECFGTSDRHKYLHT